MTDATESKLKNWGLLLMRVGLGAAFVYFHGWDKIKGGPETWAQLGKSMSHLGVTFLPAFWGFMAAFAEFGGGICLALGLFFRPMAAMMAFTMAVATTMLYQSDKGFSYPLELGIVFLALAIIGPGQMALDRVFFGGASRRKSAT